MEEEKEMEWTETNEDGTKTKYKIGYSQVLQKEIAKELKTSNRLKILIIGCIVILIGLGVAIVFSRVVTNSLVRIICPIA